ncbi:recombinase family protein [Exiguobacterium sp. BG5(2022)]|uniref:recombinase family protein n=1 Tax=Exiguobacterium sp. BG5(2022) TaxID=2962595 RepID=UPI002881CBCC|nr:recombinase family protein [Exiguobacterium sp. BG5(2022)]MDT0193724.1 recombinase family protein [Exiguobacterium sp. BG5(2022)]
MAKIGYARVSTKNQNLDLQIDKLEEVGCEKIFYEKRGATQERPEFEKCLEYLRNGDKLVVWKLDRLGRTMRQLINLVEDLKERDIHLHIVNDGIDTSTDSGKLMFTIFSMFAETERNMIIERTKVGLESARKRGRVGGRKKIDPDVLDRAFMMYDSGFSVMDICRTLPIQKSTFHKYNKDRIEVDKSE